MTKSGPRSNIRVDAPIYRQLYSLHQSTYTAFNAMSDPVVVAMGDEKLKDIDGTEEKPEEVVEAATHSQEKENTDAPSTPTKVCPPFLHR